MSSGSRSATMRSNAWTRTAVAQRLAILVGAALAAALAGSSLATVSSTGSTTTPGILDPGLSTTGSALEHVVVSGSKGAMDAVRSAVARVGGHSGAGLPIVDG
ncbi:MAG: hypothetical protein JWO88_2783, partial [Frankiales bacterium]|nr:hypothetical protein [Frankiales bacterium]